MLQRPPSTALLQRFRPVDEIEEFHLRHRAHDHPERTAVDFGAEGAATNSDGGSTMSPQDFERIQGLRRVVHNSADYSEGIRAFKEKRKPKFNGR